MSRAFASSRVLVATAIVAALAAFGCSNIRIPAIDPSGQRIFSGGSTTLAGPDFAHCPLFARPATTAATAVPVVTAPPTRPPCASPSVPLVVQPVAVQPVVVVPTAPPACPPTARAASPQTCGPGGCPDGPQLKLCPSQLVAPVGSEVLLAAGLCGPNGYYITNQPIEWMLAPDGVGQIVQVGKETSTAFASYFRSTPHKVGPNYVRALTSTTSQVITRGTPSPLDDVGLERGQSWISITSPTEGTSSVTVWAPHEGNWEKRRQTATIFWVDAKWKYPAPAIVRSGAGGRHVLTTKLERSGGAPIAGWIVRYDVLEGPDAAFGAAGEKSVEGRTEADGTFRAELVATSGQAGITTVRVQIIRPQSKPGDFPTMVVGQGMTSVTWSSPGLHVRAAGPETVPVDGTLSYRVEVFNSGDTAARDVKLNFTPPTGVTFLNANPAGAAFGQMHQWRIGDLQPGTTTIIEVNCRATRSGDIRACFRAESGEGKERLAAEGCSTTRVFASALSVKMTGPEKADVGTEAQFKLEVTNTGRTPLVNVTITDNFDAGLTHTDGQASPIVKVIDQIAPSETKRIAINFRVDQPGKLCHRVDVVADGGHAAATRGCVTGVEAAVVAPKATLRVVGPTRLEIGKKEIVKIEIQNTSTGTLSNLRLAVSYPKSMEALQATDGPLEENGALNWLVPRLLAGETLTKRVEFQGKTADARAQIVAQLTSDQTAAQESRASITVAQPAITPPRPGGGVPMPMPGAGAAPPPAANAGNLKVSVAKMNDDIAVGETATYNIDIENRSPQADENVEITLVIPAGLKFKSAAPAPQYSVLGVEGAMIELVPIKSIRANEKLQTLKVALTGDKAGDAKLQVEVRSKRNPKGIVSEAAPIKVYPANP